MVEDLRAIEKEFPELAKRLRKAGLTRREGYDHAESEVFPRIPEGTNTKSLTLDIVRDRDFFDVSKEKTGVRSTHARGEKVATLRIAKDQVSHDNAGIFDVVTYILFQKAPPTEAVQDLVR